MTIDYMQLSYMEVIKNIFDTNSIKFDGYSNKLETYRNN